MVPGYNFPLEIPLVSSIPCISYGMYLFIYRTTGVQSIRKSCSIISQVFSSGVPVPGALQCGRSMRAKLFTRESEYILTAVHVYTRYAYHT